MSAHLESRLRDILRERRSDPGRVIASASRDESVDARTRLHAAADAIDGDVIDAASGP